MVDHIVGHLGGDDLTLQLVGVQFRCELLHHGLGKDFVHFMGQQGLIGQVAVDQCLLQVALDVGDQNRQLGTGQSLLVQLALGKRFIIRQELQVPVELVRLFHRVHQPPVFLQPGRSLQVGDAQRLGLAIVVLQHQLGHIVSHLNQQLIALLLGQVAIGHHAVEQNLHVDLVVGTVHTTGIINKVGVQASAPKCILNPPQLRHAQVAALAHHLATQLRAVDAQAIVGLVPDIAVCLAGRLDVGADTAKPEQVHLGLEDMADQHVRGHPVGLDIQQLLHFRTDRDRLGASAENAAPLGDQLRVIVAPGGTGHGEQPLPLGVALGRIGLGIDKDVHVVEGSHQPGFVRAQQAVAEHVSGHIPNANGGEFIGRRVDPQFPEVPLHRHPGALGGDAHFLVIVTVAAPRGEGIAHPEAILGRQAVGNVREGGGTLVGGHHQVMVVLVMTDEPIRRPDLAVHQVVGNIQQPPDKALVGFHPLLVKGIAVRGIRQLLGDKSPLGPHRHDDGILHLLGFDQAEDFGAVVLETVRPAQAAPGHAATPQMHAFHPGRVDKDLEHRHGQWHIGNAGRVELQGDVVLGLVLIELEVVGAQGCLHQLQVQPQHPVFAEIFNAVQFGGEFNLQFLLARHALGVTAVPVRIEPDLEEFQQQPRQLHMIDQRVGDEGLTVGDADLAHVAGVGTQQRNFPPAHVRRQQQPVKAVVLRLAIPYPAEQVLEDRLDAVNIHHHPTAGLQGEVVNPHRAVIAIHHLEGMFTNDTEPQVVKDGHHVGQRQRLVRVEQLEVEGTLGLLERPVETHAEPLVVDHAGNVFEIDGRTPGREHILIGGGEGGTEQMEDLVAPLLTVGLTEGLVQTVAPGLCQFDDPFLQLSRGQLAVFHPGNADGELDPCQHRLGKMGHELDVLGLQALAQYLLHFQP